MLSSAMTLEQAYPLFLTHGRAERQYAAETLTKLKDCFSAWILPRLGSKDLETLSRYDILLFRSALVDANLGVNRQYGVLMALKLFLKFCRQVLRIDCLDPNTEIKLPQRPKPHVHYLTNEEGGRLCDVIRTTTFTGPPDARLGRGVGHHGPSDLRGVVARSGSI